MSYNIQLVSLGIYSFTCIIISDWLVLDIVKLD